MPVQLKTALKTVLPRRAMGVNVDTRSTPCERVDVDHVGGGVRHVEVDTDLPPPRAVDGKGARKRPLPPGASGERGQGASRTRDRRTLRYRLR
jgi:hypothetical protein